MDLGLPRPPKYVEEWPLGLCLGVLGHHFTYFIDLGLMFFFNPSDF